MMASFINVFKRIKRCLFKAMPALFLIILFLTIGYGMANACDPNGPNSNCPTLWNVQSNMSVNTWLSLKIIYIASAICGLMLIATSLMVFKGAADGGGGQQQGNQTKKGIVLFILGGCMISLPFMANVSQNGTLGSGLTTGSQFIIPSESDANSSGTGPGDNWASHNDEDT
jgi:hypothetical protein